MKRKNIVKKLKKVLSRESKASHLRLGIPQPPEIINFFKKEFHKLLELNPNNIGTSTRMDVSKDSCRELEKKLINKFSVIFGSGNDDGYISSGSTEGNIMGLWIARESMKKFGDPIVIAHHNSHYSIRKACRILNLESVFINENEWSKPMDSEALSKITKDINRPIICVATIGHTTTGLVDDIDSIYSYLKNNSQNSFYVHVDAAIGAFFFSRHQVKKIMSYENINSMTFDLHKYGFSYYPSGVFLCKKDLQENIKGEAEYISIFDDTLIGSRSGAVPSILWANMELRGVDGINNDVDMILKNKEIFIEKIKKKGNELIFDNIMPVVCVVRDKELDIRYRLKYRLRHSVVNGKYYYSVFFYREYSKQYDELVKIL